MNNLVYLCLSILEISKTLMYEFQYDCIEPKYQYNGKLCHADTDNVIIHIKTKDVYKHIADNVEKRSDKSNYAIKRSVSVGKKRNVNGLKKDELG